MWHLDTNAPLHHNVAMRLTVNLDPDLYALAKSLARADDCSISAAVNRLIRRSLASTPPPTEAGPGGFPVSRGRIPVTADTVRQIEADDDGA